VVGERLFVRLPGTPGRADRGAHSVLHRA
jgi:hypothetical protein